MNRTALPAAIVALLVACGGEAPPPQPPAPAPTPTQEPTPPAPPVVAPAPKLSKAELAKKTFEAMHAASNAHDTSRIASFYAADAVKETAGPEGWMAQRGHDQIKAGAERMMTMAPEAKWTNTRVLHKDDVIVQEYVVNASPPGKKVGVRGLAIYWFDEEGKIKKERIYLDQPTAMIQSGVVQGKAPEPVAAPSSEGPWVVAKGDPSEEKHVEAFKSSWPAIWPKKDRKAYEAVLTDDFVQDDVAWGMTFKGKTEAGKGMDSFTKAVPDLAITVDSAWAFGDVVVAELTMKGTHKGPLGTVKATNKPFTAHVANVVDHRDAKQAKSAVYMNSAEMLGQLGLLPKPDGKKDPAKPDAKKEEKKPDAKK